jgi:hypothetical protein
VPGPFSIWNEGTAQYVAAGGRDAQAYLDELRRQQGSDGAMPGSPDTFHGGDVWLTPWHGIAPTAWRYFADTGGPFVALPQSCQVYLPIVLKGYFWSFSWRGSLTWTWLALSENVVQSFEVEIAGDFRGDGCAPGQHIMELLIVHADGSCLRREGQALPTQGAFDQADHFGIGYDVHLPHREPPLWIDIVHPVPGITLVIFDWDNLRPFVGEYRSANLLIISHTD